MSKRWWIFCSIGLLIFISFGMNQTGVIANRQAEHIEPLCESVDQEMQSEIEEILDIFRAEDYGALTDRLNELEKTTESIGDERQLLESAICFLDVYGDRDLLADVNIYHSLLTFVMQADKNIQFEEIIFTPDQFYELIQVEGIIQGERENVHIEHYSAFQVLEPYLSREARESRERLEEKEKNSGISLKKMLSGLASSAHDILQNPLERFMMTVDSFYIGKADLDKEIFDKESFVNASYFNLNYSVITYDGNRWDPINLVEYYPSTNTSDTLDRIEEVLEELPDYWFPREKVEQGDWNGYADYYREHRMDMIEYDFELYEYMFGNTLVDSRTFEEMIERVKREHQVE